MPNAKNPAAWLASRNIKLEAQLERINRDAALFQKLIPLLPDMAYTKMHFSDSPNYWHHGTLTVEQPDFASAQALLGSVSPAARVLVQDDYVTVMPADSLFLPGRLAKLTPIAPIVWEATVFNGKQEHNLECLLKLVVDSEDFFVTLNASYPVLREAMPFYNKEADRGRFAEERPADWVLRTSVAPPGLTFISYGAQPRTSARALGYQILAKPESTEGASA